MAKLDFVIQGLISQSFEFIRLFIIGSYFFVVIAKVVRNNREDLLLSNELLDLLITGVNVNVYFVVRLLLY